MVFRNLVLVSIGALCFAGLTAHAEDAASAGDKCRTRSMESKPGLCISSEFDPPRKPSSGPETSAAVSDETQKALCDTWRKCQVQCGGQGQGQGQGRTTASSPNGGSSGGECSALEKQLKELDDELSKHRGAASN